MNRIYILIVSLTAILSAEISTDIALTFGYNRFDDPEILKKSKNFYGAKMGVYKDGIYGLQIGYEQADDVNCQELDFKRTYLNGVLILKQPYQFRTYAMATVGYEESNIEYFKPNQTFVGAGLGVKKILYKDFNVFVETRVLKKIKSHDKDIITGIGVGYSFK